MKKLFFLIAIGTLFLSCEDNVQLNSPALQAQKNYSFWRSKQTTISLNTSGQLEINAFSGFETIVMKTATNAIGTYEFGTTNANNFASYTLDKSQTENNIDRIYTSAVVNGPVNKVSNLLSNGLNYVNETIVETTTSGGGNGLRLKVTTNVNGSVSGVTIVSRGINYRAGDIVYLTGGNNNAAVQVVNTQQSNGQIKIEKIENGTYSGKFNFNVVDDAGEVVSYTEGIFYRIPLNVQ